LSVLEVFLFYWLEAREAIVTLSKEGPEYVEIEQVLLDILSIKLVLFYSQTS